MARFCVRRQPLAFVLAVAAALALAPIYLIKVSPFLDISHQTLARSATVKEKEVHKLSQNHDQHNISQRGTLRGIRVLLDPEDVHGAIDDKIELVYQTPEGFHPSLRTKALLFIAHGCSHAATDMFDHSESCEQCIGLPIEKRIVRSALKKGFAVVAVTSSDR